MVPAGAPGIDAVTSDDQHTVYNGQTYNHLTASLGAAQVMLLQPGPWLGAFLEGPAAAELAAPAGNASTEVLHSLLLQGEAPAAKQPVRA